MSFLTATQCELIHSSFTAGTALVSSTTQTVLSPRGNTTPLPYIPSGFFNAAYGANKALKFIARGVVSTAASSQGTITAGLYFASSDTATVGTSTGAVTGAFTPSASLSSAIWEFSATLVCGAPGPVPNLFSMGQMLLSPTAGSAATVNAGVGGTAATTGLTTESPYFLQFAWTWSANSASNTVTMYQTEVWGLN